MEKKGIATVTGNRNRSPKHLMPPGERMARRQGALKGGKARAVKLSRERRREIALKATLRFEDCRRGPQAIGAYS